MPWYLEETMEASASIIRPVAATRAIVESSRFRWVIVALLCSVGFVLFVTRMNITVAGRLIRDELGFTQAGLGRILGAFMFGYALGLVPGGWLADRFGPRRVLVAGTLLWGLFTLLTGLVQGPGLGGRLESATLLVLARFLLGLCQGCAFPTFARAAANWVCRSERALTMGLLQSAAILGGAITPVLTQAVIAEWGWRQVFFASAVLTFAVAASWWGIATDGPAEHPRVSLEELRLITARPADGHATRVDRAWLRRLAHSGTAYLLCLSQFCFGVAGFVFFSWFYVYFVEQRHTGEGQAALLQALAYLAMTVGAATGGYLCDRAFRRWGSPWGRRAVPIAAITLAGGCGMIAPTLVDNMFSGLLFALAAGLLYAATPGFWSTVIDLTQQGTGVLGGLQNGANWLGAALATTYAPAFVGVLRSWQVAAPWERALQLASGIGLLSAVLWLLIDSSRGIDGG
jgi:MFS transporter, ACS family, glucarate transporter